MKFSLVLFSIALILVCNSFAQTGEAGENPFTIDLKVPVTPVKNQYRSSTCWSFAVLAVLETELINKGKDTLDLSEMYIVRKAYSEKSEVYVRMHGEIKFTGGGALNDPIDIISKYGIVPDKVYDGLQIGEKNHKHSEMDEVLKGYVEKIILNENGKLSPVWHNGFEKILDTYLGRMPETFTYKGKTYTPQTFLNYLEINTEDYVLLSSFTHHPFYAKFILEVPDNWSWGAAYNLPLDELTEVIDYSLNKNYTVAIACDITENGFDHKAGTAMLTQADWEELGIDTDKDNKIITQEIRQIAFDNYQTTDDHGVQIYGIAHDNNGTKFYVSKNSWGTEIHGFEGHLYISEHYLRYKTLSLLVNKNGIPKNILEKLKMD